MTRIQISATSSSVSRRKSSTTMPSTPPQVIVVPDLDRDDREAVRDALEDDAGEEHGDERGQAGVAGRRERGRPARARRRRRPRSPAIAIEAWLARTPYQGCDCSSRRSVVARIATHAPAVGPPRIIAAPTNGRWNVKWPAPSRRDGAHRPEQAEQRPEQDAAGRAGERGAVERRARDRRARSGRRWSRRRARPRPAMISAAVKPSRMARRVTRASTASSGLPSRPVPRSSLASRSTIRRSQAGRRVSGHRACRGARTGRERVTWTFIRGHSQ